MIRKIFGFKVIISLTLLLNACGGSSADLRAARNLAILGEDANTTFKKIANDVYHSCLRQARYVPLQLSEEAPIDNRRRESEKKCEDNSKQASFALEDANSVVVAYLGALGSLSSDNLTNYKELDSIGKSLKRLQSSQLFTSDQVDAGTAIAKFLFRIATEKFRREQLKDAVVNTDSYLTTYIKGLSKAINSGYIKTLESEKISVDEYYRGYIGNIISTGDSRNEEGINVAVRDAAVTELDSQWQNAKVIISEKQQLAQNYVEILELIAIDHNKIKKMYVKGETPSATQVNKMVKSYIKQLEPLVEKSNKLFEQKKNNKI